MTAGGIVMSQIVVQHLRSQGVLFVVGSGCTHSSYMVVFSETGIRTLRDVFLFLYFTCFIRIRPSIQRHVLRLPPVAGETTSVSRATSALLTSEISVIS